MALQDNAECNFTDIKPDLLDAEIESMMVSLTETKGPIENKNPEQITSTSFKKSKKSKFMPWLIEVLESGKFAEHGAGWIDRDTGIFSLPWPRQNTLKWTENDSAIFKDCQSALNPRDKFLQLSNYAKLKEKFRAIIRKYTYIGLKHIQTKGGRIIYQFSKGIPNGSDYSSLVDKSVKYESEGFTFQNGQESTMEDAEIANMLLNLKQEPKFEEIHTEQKDDDDLVEPRPFGHNNFWKTSDPTDISNEDTMVSDTMSTTAREELGAEIRSQLSPIQDGTAGSSCPLTDLFWLDLIRYLKQLAPKMECPRDIVEFKYLKICERLWDNLTLEEKCFAKGRARCLVIGIADTSVAMEVPRPIVANIELQKHSLRQSFRKNRQRMKACTKKKTKPQTCQ